MADRPWWHRILERVGARVYRIDDLKPVYDAEAAAAGRYIFVHNDPISTMQAVTKWLERSFDMDVKSAAATMIGIHHHGHAAIGPFAPLEAERRLERARRVAAELGLTKLAFSRQPPPD